MARAGLSSTRAARWLMPAVSLAGLLVGTVSFAPSIFADERQPSTVLILLPGQPTGTHTAIDQFAAGTRRALLDVLPANSSVYVEYMDLARLAGPAEQGELRDWYRVKYAGQPPALIVAAGQEPRGFLIRFRQELWPEIPVIFAGMDERSLKNFTFPVGTVALITRYDEEGTIRAALALLPDTRHVALISGASKLDQYLRGLWLDALGRIRAHPELIDLAGLPLDALSKRLASLPPHTVVFFSSCFSDGTGRALVGSEVLPALAAAANRPMFTIHGSVLGQGIVGGSLTDYGTLGRQTGELAASVIEGAPLPQDPVRATGVNKLLFDWRELRRWNLSEDRLPAGSAVLFRPPSAWELYRWPIVVGISLLVAQAVLIAALLINRAQRLRVQRELDERLRFERFLADFSRSFVDVSVERIDVEVHRGLRRIGEFLAIDRVSLYELARRHQLAQIVYSWSADGVPSLPAAMAAEGFPWVSPRLGRGEVVSFPRLDELPREARVDRATFDAYGTRSHASIPFVEEGATRHVLALTSVRGERAWPAALVEGVRLVTEILGQILARKHAEAEVEESHALQRAMLSTLPSGMAVLDAGGRILAVNQSWLGQAGESDRGLMARARVGISYVDACREAIRLGESGAREVAAAIEAVLAGSSAAQELEYSVKRPVSEQWFHLSVMALRGSRGGAVVAHTDVTEQVVAREQLRQFSGHLLAAQEEERRHIARDLHDDLNQRLVLLAIEISQLDDAPVDGRPSGSARRMAERVGEIAADVHRLAYRLHPFKLEYLGLAGAARGLCEEIASAHGLAIAFAERDVPGALPSAVAVCAYRVLQEALSNVVKHSGSPRADVELIGESASIRLTIRDFGMGIGPDVVATSRGLGLSSMRERLRVVHGVLALEPMVTPGTALTVRIPLFPAVSPR